MKKHKYSFQKGWNNLRVYDQNSAKSDLKKALAVNNDCSFRNYRRGVHYMSASQYINVEKIFHKYNVKDIWDEH